MIMRDCVVCSGAFCEDTSATAPGSAFEYPPCIRYNPPPSILRPPGSTGKRGEIRVCTLALNPALEFSFGEGDRVVLLVDFQYADGLDVLVQLCGVEFGFGADGLAKHRPLADVVSLWSFLSV